MTIETRYEKWASDRTGRARKVAAHAMPTAVANVLAGIIIAAGCVAAFLAFWIVCVGVALFI